MWRVFFTSAVVAVVVRVAMGWCKSGNCGHFGAGGFIIWDISGLGSSLSSCMLTTLTFCLALDLLLENFFFPRSFILCSGQEDYSFEELLPMAVIGIIGGLLGRAFEMRFTSVLMILILVS